MLEPRSPRRISDRDFADGGSRSSRHPPDSQRQPPPPPLPSDSLRADPRRPQRLLLFCNGANYFKGKSVIVNTKQYRNFGDFLSDMTNRLPTALPLAHGVRQVFTPVRGTRVRQLSQLQDGESYVCAGFETFKPVGYGGQVEYLSASDLHTGRKRTKSTRENLDSSRSTSVRTNSPTRPFDRHSNASGISEAPPPAGTGRLLHPSHRSGGGGGGGGGGAAASVKTKPRIITIYRNSLKPIHNVKILFNRQSVQSYDQLLADLAEAFDAELPRNPITKLRCLDGRAVRGISELFRDADRAFIGFGREEVDLGTVHEIFNHLCRNDDRANELSRRWEERERDDEAADEKRPPAAQVQSNGVRRPGQDAPIRSTPASKSRGRRGPKAPRKFLERRAEAIEKMNHLAVLPAIKTDPRNSGAGGDSGERRKEKENDDVEDDYFAKSKADFDRSDSHLSSSNASVSRALNQTVTLVGRRKGEVNGGNRRGNFHPSNNNNNLSDDDGGFQEISTEIDDAGLENSTGLEERFSTPSAPRRNEEFYDLSESIFKGYIHSKFSEREAKKELETPSKDYIVHDDEDEDNAYQRTKFNDAERFSPGNVEDSNGWNEDNATPDDVVQPDAVGQHLEDVASPQETIETKAKDEKMTSVTSRHERHVPSDAAVMQLYELGDVLGDGNFAVVRFCRERSTRKEFAMKIVDKAKLKGKENLIENEILIMKTCSHPNIVKLFHEYETVTELFLLMEFVGGGDLFDFITRNAPFSEMEAAGMIYDLAKALHYLHCRNIVHRDVKPENIVVQNEGGDVLSLKLTDFGLATEVHERLITVCGTPTYVAPEILKEIGYGLEIDMWATGVILYILLCGFAPFRGEDPDQLDLFEAIKSGYFEFVSPFWDNASDGVRDLIVDLLQVDTRKRLTAIDVICHPFIITCAGTFSPPDVHQLSKNLRNDLKRDAIANRNSFEAVLARLR